MDMVLDLRAKAKAAKDWATSDKIRDELAAAGFEVKGHQGRCDVETQQVDVPPYSLPCYSLRPWDSLQVIVRRLL